MLKIFLPIILSTVMTTTIQARPVDPLALGKCMSLPLPDRVANLEALNVDCFYTWHYRYVGPETEAQFIPMVWGMSQGEAVLADPDLLDDSEIVLLFNECDAPNESQCIATPQEAAEMTLRLQAAFPDRLWGSPAVHNWGVDQQWLDKYMQACDGCKIDFIAVHYYSWSPCDSKDFRNYVRSFKRFDRPIWLTEYGCLSPNVAERVSYYQDWYDIASRDRDIIAVFPWTEGLPVDWPYWTRWGIFVNNDNTLTELGEWYAAKE